MSFCDFFAVFARGYPYGFVKTLGKLEQVGIATERGAFSDRVAAQKEFLRVREPDGLQVLTRGNPVSVFEAPAKIGTIKAISARYLFH